MVALCLVVRIDCVRVESVIRRVVLLHDTYLAVVFLADIDSLDVEFRLDDLLHLLNRYVDGFEGYWRRHYHAVCTTEVEVLSSVRYCCR